MRATQVIAELNEAVAATVVLARASAYAPAYERYLAFTNVVRQIHGPRPPEYRRIHLRASDTAEDAPVAPPTGDPS